MGLFSFFKKKEEKQDFSKMDKKQKKEFLSNDLIERMIRVEQRVSASFGQPIHYKNTNYYKSLTEKERKDFHKHVKSKHPKLFFYSLIALAYLYFSFSITGNFILDESTNSLNFLGLGMLFLNVFIIGFLLILVYEKRKREKRLNSIHKVIEKSLKRK